MPDLVAVALMIAGALAMYVGARKLIDLLVPRRRVAPVEPRGEVDMKRLLKIAAVTDEEIIKAAEWRAEHPGEPEPKVLADLDPSTWTRTPAIPQVPPPPTDVSTAVSDAWIDIRPGAIVVSPTAQDFYADAFLKAINRSDGRLAVIPNSMEYKPLSPKPRARIVPSYDSCQHEDAEREEIRWIGSTAPVRTFVTSCEHCDKAHLIKRYKQLAAEISNLLRSHDVDSGPMPLDKFQAYRAAMTELATIKRRLQDMEQRDTDRELGERIRDQLRKAEQ